MHHTAKPLLQLPEDLLNEERRKWLSQPEFTESEYYHDDTVTTLLDEKIRHGMPMHEVTPGLTMEVDSEVPIFAQTDHKLPHRYAAAVLVGHNHFIGCILERTEQGDALTIIDPIQSEERIAPHDYPRTQEVIALMQRNFADLNLAKVQCNPRGMIHQGDDVSCGPATIESLVCVLAKKDPRDVPGVAMHKGVSTLEGGAMALRLQHAEVMSQRSAWNQFEQQNHAELDILIQDIIAQNEPKDAMEILHDMGALGQELTPEQLENGENNNALFIGEKIFQPASVREVFETQDAILDKVHMPNGTNVRPDATPGQEGSVKERSRL